MSLLIFVCVSAAVFFGNRLQNRSRLYVVAHSANSTPSRIVAATSWGDTSNYSHREMSSAQVSKSLDQLRMCLAAGLSVPMAIHEVAMMKDAHPKITWLDTEMRRDPANALRLARIQDSAFSTVAHLLERSFITGAPLHSALGTLNEQLHNTVTQDITRRVRAVGVKAVLPLGLCFLPAFVLLTVVPIAVGLFTRMSW